MIGNPCKPGDLAMILPPTPGKPGEEHVGKLVTVVAKRIRASDKELAWKVDPILIDSRDGLPFPGVVDRCLMPIRPPEESKKTEEDQKITDNV